MTSSGVPSRAQPLLAGVFPVLATPLRSDGAVSAEDFDRIIDFNLSSGVDGVVFPANASEVGSLSPDERQMLTERLFARVAGRVPIVVGLSARDSGVSMAMARQARALSADAVMIAPPADAGGGYKALVDLLSNLAEASGADLILQNAPPPLGPGLAPAAVVDVMRNVPALTYVKEECLPAGQRITQYVANASRDLRGVFGGAAGRFVMDELARGAVGTMPSCEIPEVHVALMRAYRDGDVARARAIYNRMAPLLMLTSVFRAAGVKSVLRMRGVIASELCRDPVSGLDERDHRELHAILATVGVATVAGHSAQAE